MLARSKSKKKKGINENHWIEIESDRQLCKCLFINRRNRFLADFLGSWSANYPFTFHRSKAVNTRHTRDLEFLATQVNVNGNLLTANGGPAKGDTVLIPSLPCTAKFANHL